MTDYEGFLDLVRRRRSIRRFKPDPVPDEMIEKVLEAARWAPSGANAQPWEFLVIRDPETKAKVEDLYRTVHPLHYQMELTREERMRHPAAYRPDEIPPIKDAPALIILLGDPRRKEAYILSALTMFPERNWYSDLANAFLYMHLAARSLGLGSHWISTTHHPYVQAMLKQLLGAPKDYMIYDTMALGYPAYEPRGRTVRDLGSLVHYDRYDRAEHPSDEEVRDFIAAIHMERVQSRPAPPAS